MTIPTAIGTAVPSGERRMRAVAILVLVVALCGCSWIAVTRSPDVPLEVSTVDERERTCTTSRVAPVADTLVASVFTLAFTTAFVWVAILFDEKGIPGMSPGRDRTDEVVLSAGGGLAASIGAPFWISAASGFRHTGRCRERYAPPPVRVRRSRTGTLQHPPGIEAPAPLRRRGPANVPLAPGWHGSLGVPARTRSCGGSVPVGIVVENGGERDATIDVFLVEDGVAIMAFHQVEIAASDRITLDGTYDPWDDAGRTVTWQLQFSYPESARRWRIDTAQQTTRVEECDR